MNNEALLTLSATDAVAAMVRGEVTAEAYASALLWQCEALKSVNALITLDPERVLEAAQEHDRQRRAGKPFGLLHGIPIPVKDSINTRDFCTTAGTPALRGFRPPDDAPIVRTLINAGALVLGKTNLHELSLGWTSNNLAFGAVRNPYDPTRIPGGSSGGTAVAIASGMAPLGLAEDTQGSILVPAALCGIVRFRPTTTRYPTAGTAPITALFDQVGPMAPDGARRRVVRLHHQRVTGRPSRSEASSASNLASAGVTGSAVSIRKLRVLSTRGCASCKKQARSWSWRTFRTLTASSR